MNYLISILVVVFSLSAAGHVSLYSDSGIRGPAYSVIVKSMYELAGESSGWVTPIEYGRTVSKRPLLMVRIEKPGQSNWNTRKAIVISGATHGNEYINIADRLPRWFYEARESADGLSEFFNQGGAVYIIPILNPDGYDTRRRKNRRNVDLNRDFALLPLGHANFSQPETRLLAQVIESEIEERNLSLAVTVDYHCCDGSLLFPWSYTKRPLPGNDREAHEVIGELMKQHINSRYRTGSTGQVLGYTPKGTSKDYYYAKYGALSYTYEGARRVENQYFPKHKVWWNAILNFVSEDSFFN